MRLFAGVLFAACLVAQVEVREESSKRRTDRARADIRFQALGVKWTGLGPAGIRVRVSNDGTAWSDWRAVVEDPDTACEDPMLHNGRLLYFEDGARWAEYEVESGYVSEVKLIFIDPGASSARSSQKTSAPSVLPSRPRLISRLEWGSPDGDRSRAPSTYTTVTHLIVHHTADGPVSDYAAWIRAIWAFHVNSNGWIDIGYNYLIAPDGTIFEGRAGGDNVLGAHFSCQNSGTTGVALLGDFTTAGPTPQALDSLAQLLSWRANALNLDPLASSLHRGTNLTMPVISSHRDGNPSPLACTRTACPGDVLYPMLQQLRERVAALTTWTTTGLWRPSSKRGRTGYWYGDPATGTFNTGSANGGALESPVFVSNGRLRFASWFETEIDTNVWDEKFVEYRPEGGAWQALTRISGATRQWTEYEIALPAGRVQIRFRFDTVDRWNNDFEGWYVADIAVP